MDSAHGGTRHRLHRVRRLAGPRRDHRRISRRTRERRGRLRPDLPDPDPERAGARERGNTTGVQFSVVVINPLGRATAASAVDNGLSPVAILDGEAGNYLVTVHKDAEGGEGYNVTIDCHDANGSALGIRATRVQNQ
jgi:hypothetical protein